MADSRPPDLATNVESMLGTHRTPPPPAATTAATTTASPPTPAATTTAATATPPTPPGAAGPDVDPTNKESPLIHIKAVSSESNVTTVQQATESSSAQKLIAGVYRLGPKIGSGSFGDIFLGLYAGSFNLSAVVREGGLVYNNFCFLCCFAIYLFLFFRVWCI